MAPEQQHVGAGQEGGRHQRVGDELGLPGGWPTDTVWKLPLWIPLLPLPLGIGLLCLQYVAEMIKLGKEPS